MYEFSINFSILNLVKFFWLLLPIGIYCFSKAFENRSWIIVTKAVAILLLCLVIVIIIEPVYTYFYIKEAYDSDNIQSLEGVVEDFCPAENIWAGHSMESFCVNGVYFDYTNYEDFGYCKYAAQGGIIQKEGQFVRMKYYKLASGRNIICYIEVIE